ncbi:MAG TPA: Uma2 family endonuclease [Gemmataceae bacterium]|nr:Uma2 family endonuclease [Gemmataceae bacterium]
MNSVSYEEAIALGTVTRAAVAPLQSGDVLTRDEFIHRWENMPLRKRAELIQGVVYMPSPLSREHGVMENNVAGWLALYRAATPGVEAADNSSWLMGPRSMPQPDVSLYVLPEYGSRSRLVDLYMSGAPEFVTEVCVSSAAYDLHQKLELYQEHGVQEYLAVLMQEREVRWHRLTGERFEVVPAPADGIYRSAVFAGLWLDAAALLAGDLARVLAVLNDGLRSPEHAAFVQQLAARRTTP